MWNADANDKIMQVPVRGVPNKCPIVIIPFDYLLDLNDLKI